ncbi:hypothetical protein RHGRI_020732 [Rhododendron griersonianum]|uniref:Uncharacterized protein n=1 Tax=Rhododendron griersonianum TaxID=479676 RepID=A0AAV6JLS7_9ERIC|nr:hypothetical protein RHGRI_020732 [Rhododendron griersonianum]
MDIWKQLLARNNVCRDPGCLAQELEWTTQNEEGEGLHNTLYKLSLAATLYHLWRERNFRVYQHKKEDPMSRGEAMLGSGGPWPPRPQLPKHPSFKIFSLYIPEFEYY